MFHIYIRIYNNNNNNTDNNNDNDDNSIDNSYYNYNNDNNNDNNDNNDNIYIYYIHLYTDIDIGLFIWFPYLFGLHGSTASREETLAEKRRMKEQQEEKKLKAPRWALDPCGSGTSGTSGQLDFGDHHPETSS